MTQYWIVGADWDGHDMTDIFIQQGYWIMGWNDENNQTYTQKRGLMKHGDGVAIKRGFAVSELKIRALGIVVGVGEREARINSRGEITGTRTPVYINWKITGMERTVSLPYSDQGAGVKGAGFWTIHGPFKLETHRHWINEVFRLI